MSRLLRKNVPEPIGLPAEVIPATRVALGETAEVLCAGVENRGRLERLAVFGLVPGAEIEIIQQHPSCVIRIDETELALDREIGEEILVRLTKRGRALSNAALAHPIDKQNS